MERSVLETLDTQLAVLEQRLDEMREEDGGEDGLFAEVVDRDGDKRKITERAVKARLKEVGHDPLYAGERAALEGYADLLQQQSSVKAKRKAAQEDLDQKIAAKYPKLTEVEIKALVVDNKWMARLLGSVQSEIDRVSETLSERVRQLADRYAIPLPRIVKQVQALAARVEGHLSKMGAT